MKTIVYSKSQQLKHYVAIFCIGIFCSLGIGGCSQDSDLAKLPESLDEASLLASQLKLLPSRVTNATNTIFVTTAKSVNFKVENSSPIIVDWGDGSNDINVFSHTYTDDFPVHTICFNGTQDALQKLECDCQLIFLDVTKDTSLTHLNCEGNHLTQLDISQNIHLLELFCSFNYLSQLDISKNKELVTLFCGDNVLFILRTGDNTKLETFDCSYNKLDEISLSGMSELRYFDCTKNTLRTIDFSGNLKLSSLHCPLNLLTKVNLSSNSRLEHLNISDNKLEMLDLTNNTSLHSISCENNHLNDLILPTSCPNLTVISCENNDFFFDPTPNKPLVLVSSLPKITTGKGLLSISETSNIETLKIIAESKNWSLVMK